MTFRQLLESTVRLSGGSAAVLALLVVLRGGVDGEPVTVLVPAVWWVVASGIGIQAGRRDAATPQIARVLATAKSMPQPPEPHPVKTLLNRLWPLLAATVISAAASLVLVQVTGVAVGFLLIWSLAWRKQAAAVQAIEERDGAEFHVEVKGLVAPLALIRTPGLRRDRSGLESQTSRVPSR